MRNKYLDIHEDDGMRHSGLVPTREDREQERLYAELTRLRRRMEIAEAALKTIYRGSYPGASYVAGLALDQLKGGE